MFEKVKARILSDLGQNEKSSSDRSWKTTRNLILGAIIRLESSECGWMAEKLKRLISIMVVFPVKSTGKPSVKSGCFNDTETSFTNLKTSIRNISNLTL